MVAIAPCRVGCPPVVLFFAHHITPSAVRPRQIHDFSDHIGVGASRLLRRHVPGCPRPKIPAPSRLAANSRKLGIQWVNWRRLRTSFATMLKERSTLETHSPSAAANCMAGALIDACGLATLTPEEETESPGEVRSQRRLCLPSVDE